MVAEVTGSMAQRGDEAAVRAGTTKAYRAQIAYQPALDGVRAVAVVMVLLFHGGISWMGGGYFGVSVFFTLSGYLITSLLFTEFDSTSRISPGAFYVRRAKRLLPASVVCLSAVSLLATGNAWLGANHLKRDLLGSLGQVANWVRLFAGESYVDVQNKTAGIRSPLDHYWSLAIEEQFYWIWPVAFFALARLAHRKGVSVSAVLGVCTLGFAASAPIISSVWGSDAAYWATPARAGEILIGALVAVLVLERRVSARRWMAPLALVVVLGFGVFLPTASGPAYDGAFPLLAIASATLLLGLQRPGAVRTALSIRPLVALGRISYGVYLYHLPIYLFVTPDRSGLRGWPLFALRIVVTMVVATASHWLIERPIRRASWTGLRTALTGAGATLVVGSVIAVVPVAAANYWGVSAASSSRAAIPVGAASTPLVVRAAVAIPTPTSNPTSNPTSTPDAVLSPSPSTWAQLARPVRILVVGDSTAQATGHGLIEWAGAHPTLAQVSLAISPGCGFVRGGRVASDGKVPFKASCDALLDQALPRDLRQLQPDVVMMLVWARDQAPRTWSKAEGELTPHDPVYLTRLVHDYRAIMTEVSATSMARVVWVRPPRGDNYWNGTDTPFTDESAHVIVEGVMHQMVDEFAGRAEFVDLRKWMETDGVAFDHAARPDGLHFTPAAALDVAERWLGAQLIRAATRSVTVSASAPPPAG